MNRLINKLILLIAASILLPLNGVGVAAFAQTAGTNSSYSRFGLGLLHDQSHGFSKSMGGAAIGVRIGNVVNTANPASYSAIDSLSLIFDVGYLNSFVEGTVVTEELLKASGLVKKLENGGVKILGNGELNVKLTVQAAKFSASAAEKIEKAGGKAEVM